MSLKNKYWFIKIGLQFLLIYLMINLMYIYLPSISEMIKPEYLDLVLYLSYIFPIIIYLIIIFFFWKKNKIFSKKKTKLIILLWLFSLIYLSNFIKSTCNYNYTQHFNFSVFIFLFFFLVIIVAPILEEIIFRDIFLKPFLKRKIIIIGIIVTSFLFAIGHFPLIYNIAIFNYIDFMDYFIFAVLLSIIRIYLGLNYAIVAHSFRNTISLLANYQILNLLFIEKVKNEILFNTIFYICLLIIIVSIIFFFQKKNLNKY